MLYVLTLTVSIFFVTDNAGAADLYGTIMAKKEIRIGISKHYPPLNFNAGKKGVEMEMAKKLGKFLGVKVKLIPLSVSQYMTALEKNRVDILLAGFSRNLKRAKSVWFSIPYVTITPGVLVRKGKLPRTRFGDEFEQAPFKTIWDLERINKFKFTVKKGSTYEYLLENHFPHMPRVSVNTDEECMDLLQKGKVHGFVHDSLYLEYLYSTSAKIRGPYTLLKGGNRREMLCIGLPFGDLVLKNQIDIFISELIRTGQIDKWLDKYNK